MSELQKRVLTAVIGVSLLLTLLGWGGFLGAWLIALVVALGMVFEFVGIAFSLPDRDEKRTVMLFATVLLAVVFGFMPGQETACCVFLFLFFSSYFLLTASRYQGATLLAHCQELMFSVFGFAYVAALPLFLPAIRRQHFGLSWVILFFLIVWAGDTGAYFAGRTFGKHKLYEKISPKKTVEGAIGGIAGSVIAAALFQYFGFNQIGLFSAVTVAVLICVVSQVGDLCESFVKRAFDKKDSGSILPGHGGFLDRFDSVVFSLPIMYACTKVLSIAVNS